MEPALKARVFAYYLPKFHPIPENDRWWGEGFTEWTNVRKAKVLFKGHDQPRVPTELGYYDLRDSDVRERQAELARWAGVEAFCYWHYWFGKGRELLERPFREVLASGKPDFPFCLAWANHSWTNATWEGARGTRKVQMLMEQRYEGEEDYRAHYESVLPAFRDKRYVRVDGKPLFVVFDALKFPDVGKFMELWRGWATQDGLGGVHFVAISENSSSFREDETGNWIRTIPRTDNTAEVFAPLFRRGFDAVNSLGKRRAEMLVRGRFRRLADILLKKARLNVRATHYDYRKIMEQFYTSEDSRENVYPTLLPQWDRSPRTGKATDIYAGGNPEAFKASVENALRLIGGKSPEHRILFLRSWNEWAEGNYVEPDKTFGRGYLEALRSAVQEKR